MATIASVVALEGMTTATSTATAAGGDELTAENGRNLVIEFRNGHSSAVTATVTPFVTSVGDARIGVASKAAITQSIPAGAERVVLIPAAVLPLYLNASGRVALSYSSHDAALVVRGIIV